MKQRIDIKPVSVNECFTGRRFKTDKYKNFEKEFLVKLKPGKMPPEPYEINLVFGFNNPGSDFDNCVKTTVDVLAKKFSFNDKKIRRATIDIEMVEKGKEFIDFTIKTKQC